MSHINNLDEKHEIVHIGAVDVPAAGVAAAEMSAELETMEKYNSSVPAQEILVSAFADMPAGQAKRKFWRLFLIGFAVAVSGTYLGYTLTIPGSIVGNQGFINQFGTVRDSAGVLSLNALYVSLWNGTNFASQVVFQIVSPFMADKLGLKLNMYIFTLLIVLAVVLEIIAKDWKVYLVAKVVSGFAAGFIGTTIMTYVSEITMPQMRGPHLSAFALFFAIGQLASAIGLDVIEKTDPLNFRLAFYSQFAILGVWAPICILLPESPVWLCKKGKHDHAKRSLRRLIGNVEGYDVEHEYRLVQQDVAASLILMERSSKHDWIACFRGANLRRTLLSTIPFSMQNFVGGPLMLNGVYFLSLVGLDSPFIANVIILALLMFGIIVSFFVVDRVGRRPLLIGGGITMAIIDLIVGGLGTKGITSSLGSFLVACVAIWAFAYAISVAPLGWLSIVELSTPMLRAKTAGIAAVLQSCSGVVFNYTVPLMLSNQYAGWGAQTGYFFGILAALMTVLVYFVIPETKGRTYAELDELFERRIPARKFKQTRTEVQDATDVRLAQR